MKNRPYFKNLYENLNALTLYRNILEKKTVKLFLQCVQKAAEDKESKKIYELAGSLMAYGEEESIGGNILAKYFTGLYLADENIYALSCEKNLNIDHSSIFKMAEKDIYVLELLVLEEIKELFPQSLQEVIFDYKPIGNKGNDDLNTILNNGSIFENLTGYYKTKGCGEMAYRAMFRYDSEKNILTGIKNPDQTDFDHIIGYEYQKDALKSNTEAFLEGYSGANALLAGSRGTGKSTCVKALSKAYFDKGLRILEISKEQLVSLPKIMPLLSKRGKYFIIFIDDLSFEDYEIEYKYLKSLLEGSAEARPSNVLFYATSNRRHIIQEKWSDKNTSYEDEEVHTSDMVNEKLSLSDRFGLTLTFPKPSPKEYVNIVKGLAQHHNISLTDEEIRIKSLSWELNNKGLSGRSAKQLIDSLVWEMKKVK